MSRTITAVKIKGLYESLARHAGAKPATEMGDEVSPFLVEFFMVQGPGFQCMAYRGGDGKWRAAFNHQLLPDSIRVLG